MKAWQPLDEYNARPLTLPLKRLAMQEGLLSMKFHFSVRKRHFCDAKHIYK
eukprot:COSAG06_NODE_858_length_11909_cov_6.018036_3_plen_51_part_00